MAPTLPIDPIAKAIASGGSTRAALRRKRKGDRVARTVRTTAWRDAHERIQNRDRREKRATCRMFGISGKRFRALERKHRRQHADS